MLFIYIQKENEAANRFISNPFVAGEIIFKTGDFGKWNQNGEVIFTGRKDYQVKIRGQRVELTEIEQILQQTVAITVPKHQLHVNNYQMTSPANSCFIMTSP